MATDIPLYSTENMGLEYTVGEQRVQAVRDCNVKIPEGAITIIYGASGSGKSSLLNIISGLQKPTNGSLLYRGEDLYSLPPNHLAYFRAHELGIVYQTNYWVKSLTSLDNVALPLYFQGASKNAAHSKAKEALERVNMLDFANKYPILLSGGEQQRIAMARAIVSDPPVIIADEPTGSLDTKNGDMIIDLIKQLNREHGKTITLVTHNMEYLYIANHLLEVQDGIVKQIEESHISRTVKDMLTDVQKRITSLMEDGKA